MVLTAMKYIVQMLERRDVTQESLQLHTYFLQHVQLLYSQIDFVPQNYNSHPKRQQVEI